MKREKDGFAYYATKTHYHYWTRLRDNVIMIYYHSDSDKLLWQKLNEDTMTPKKNSWKVLIPITNSFNASSKQELLELFDSSSPKLGVEFDQSSSGYIKDVGRVASESMDVSRTIILSIVDSQEAFTNTTLKLSELLHIKKDQEWFDSIQLRMSNNMEQLNNSLEKYIDEFSIAFGKCMAYTVELFAEIKRQGDYDRSNMVESLKQIKVLPESFLGSIEKMEFMYESIISLKTKDNTLLRSKKKLALTVKVLTEELKFAQKLASEMIASASTNL